MKILLAAVNASYMHTSLAVRSIYNYVNSRIADNIRNAKNSRNTENGRNKENAVSDIELTTVEFTINQPYTEILRKIAQSEADAVIFSTYIWNASVVEKIIPDVKKVLDCIVGAGGPEFSYAPEVYFKKLPSLDFIIHSEGEETCFEFFKALSEGNACCDGKSSDAGNACGEGSTLREFSYDRFLEIKGLYFFDKVQNKTVFTGNRDLISDLDVIPFTYLELLTDNFDPDHKIYYYESSRGCPYSCSYCFSSVDKRVRFKSFEKVKRELQIFLDANVKLVKFVDRTYNLDSDRYIGIWKYILENHNGKTMFHFEIEAEYLSEQALEFLQKVPHGIMQFEIGVQSANKKTLEAIHRSPNVEKLAANVKRIPSTIHQHLDLIAGLPFEDLDAFGYSYDFVMALKPDALQLGFLKILHGTEMESFAKQNGWKWQENAVYETFATPYMPFTDIMYLKDIEILTDAFWNKHQFDKTWNYILKNVSPWKFICTLCDYSEEKETFEAARRDTYWFEHFASFIKFIDENKLFPELNVEVLQNLLRYDFVKTGKKGGFPQWYVHRYDKDRHRALLEENGMLHSTRLAFALTELEVFDFDVEGDEPEKNPGTFEVLIKYDS